MDDGGVRTLNGVKYIPKSRKNLIFQSNIHDYGFSYISDGDMDNMKVVKGSLIMMRERRISGNI